MHSDTPDNLHITRERLQSLASDTILSPEDPTSFQVAATIPTPPPTNSVSDDTNSTLGSDGSAPTYSSATNSVDFDWEVHNVSEDHDFVDTQDETDPDAIWAVATAEHAAKEDKLRYLIKCFPTTQPFAVRRCLESNSCDLDRAFGELLDRCFTLADNGSGAGGGPKGVSAFEALENAPNGGRNRKGKKVRHRNQSNDQNISSALDRRNSLPPVLEATARESDWKRVEQEVSLLSYALNVPHATVASAYHATGGNVSATVRNLLSSESKALKAAAEHDSWLDEREKAAYSILQESCPDVPTWVVKAMIKLATGAWEYGSTPPPPSALVPPPLPPAPAKAPAVAKARAGALPPPPSMTGWSVTGRGGGGPSNHYARTHAHPPPPPPQTPQTKPSASNNSRRASEDVDAALTDLWSICSHLQNYPPPSTSTTTASTANSSVPPTPTTPLAPRFASTTQQQSTITINPRHVPPSSIPTLTSFSLSHTASQRSTLYRRANSANHLGHASAYYAAQTRLLLASATAASNLLPRPTITTSIDRSDGYVLLDLHGFRMADAVEAALGVVETWYLEKGNLEPVKVGDSRRRGGAGGVRIVVGKGRHSAGGRGVLGPAVVGALRREGWLVEVGGGWVQVKGRWRKL
ncbi:hypothetical protein DFH27DRAFT_582558 [Peziza echinospora]|nr:hypothetical protein DFH27DRAFT_582558 [Peziza echinospora]